MFESLGVDKRMDYLVALVKAAFPHGVTDANVLTFQSIFEQLKNMLCLDVDVDNDNAAPAYFPGDINHVHTLDSELFAEILRHVDLPDKTTREYCAKHIIEVLKRDKEREEELKRLNVALNAIAASGAQRAETLAMFAKKALLGKHVWLEGSCGEILNSGDESPCKT